MLDRDRILAKVDELDGYLSELAQVRPPTFEEYLSNLERRRACERVLQLAIQCALDICHLLVSGLRLGLPSEEDDLLDKLGRAGLFSDSLIGTLRSMEGSRNVLVREYGGVDDALVYKAATSRGEDFAAFRVEVADVLRKHPGGT